MTQKKPEKAQVDRAAATEAPKSSSQTPRVKRPRKRKRGEHFRPNLGSEIQLSPAELLTASIPSDDAVFIREYLRNGSVAVRAAQVAWPHMSYGGAAVHAGEVLARYTGLIAAYMDERGLTVNRFVDVIEEGLTAEQGIMVQDSKDKSHVEYVTDNRTRLGAAKLGLQLRGALQKAPTVVINAPTTNNSTTNNVTLPREVLDGFDAYMMEKTRQELIKNNKNNISNGNFDAEEGEVLE